MSGTKDRCRVLLCAYPGGSQGGGVKRGHGLGFGPLFLPEHWPESASSWHTQPGPQAQLFFGAPEGKGSAGAVACDVWSERRLRSGRGSLSREADWRVALLPRKDQEAVGDGGKANAALHLEAGGEQAQAPSADPGVDAAAACVTSAVDAGDLLGTGAILCSRDPPGPHQSLPFSVFPQVGERAVAGSTSYPARDTVLRWASLRWESRSEFFQARPGWKGPGGGGGPGAAGLQSGWKDSKKTPRPRWRRMWRETCTCWWSTPSSTPATMGAAWPSRPMSSTGRCGAAPSTGGTCGASPAAAPSTCLRSTCASCLRWTTLPRPRRQVPNRPRGPRAVLL
ncbi:uncharacterized protein [Macaca nemestrina]|uniref:uncharacterized protein n=1 Tax=Macaca nemestrina TaxID=9545 RepID=UPI0039B85264